MRDLQISGAAISMATNFISSAESDTILASLVRDIEWEQRDVVVHNRSFKQPRLVGWYGTGAYTYSGMRLEPKPLTPLLEDLQHRVEETTGQRFNSVLLNRYLAGRNHGIGMHSDNEPELGRDPVIAMLTFGEGRSLAFEPKPWFAEKQKTVERFNAPTPTGSLLVMAGQTQRNWKHGVPKAVGKRDRITLTFRTIRSA